MAEHYLAFPIEYYPDPTQGRPVFNGSVYFGVEDLDPTIEANRKNVTIVQEDGTQVPIAPNQQPLSTSAGGVITYQGSPVQLLIDGTYSIAVLNNQGAQVYYVSKALYPLSDASLITYTPDPGDTTTVEAALRALDVENIAALRLISGANAQKALVNGYYVSGDGGGGEFYWDAASLEADNGGTIIQATGVTTGRWKRIYLEFISPKWFGCLIDGATDDTTNMQATLNAGLKIRLPPESVMLINPAIGLVVREGHTILGGGQDSTVITTTTVGGTVFKRVDPAVDINRVRNVVIRDLAVVLNHPGTANPANYEQIAFDFRSISRGILDNVYAGNYSRGPLRVSRPDPADQSDACQGYGVLCGTDNVNYSGGEVNSVINSQFYGLKKCITVDDLTLSPASAAYATLIDNNDIQISESGIAIESQFNAGSSITDNTVQAIQKARDSTNTTYCYRMAGRDSYLRNKYIEVTIPACDFILRCESASKRNVIDLGLIGNDDSFIGIISDVGGWGNHNRISYAVPSTNRAVHLDGNVNTELGRDYARVLFDGAATILGTPMAIASVVRNGVGDFSVNFASNTFPDANYTYSIDCQLDVSGSALLWSVRTQSASALRIITRTTAGAPVDPLRVAIRCG